MKRSTLGARRSKVTVTRGRNISDYPTNFSETWQVCSGLDLPEKAEHTKKEACMYGITKCPMCDNNPDTKGQRSRPHEVEQLVIP